jgi:hypothetical protein
MFGVKVALAASTFVGTFLIGLMLSLSSHLQTVSSWAQAGSPSFGQTVIAREASEGPRGFDNERPGDRHRGRRGRAIEHGASMA